jgi:TQXA domain-containing protein
MNIMIKKGISSLLVALCMVVTMLSTLPTTTSTVNAASEGSYVGIRGDSSINTSDGYSGGSVFELYVTPRSNYNKLFSGVAMDESEIEVAYCFNQSKEWPQNTKDGWWQDYPGNDYLINGFNLYNKAENVSGSTFINTATKARSGLSADDFRNKIISIGLNGYPYDYSGFNTDENGNQIVSDNSFRTLTQRAIWYYTDSKDYSYTNNRGSWSTAEQQIYEKLIKSMLPETITNQYISALDLYLWDENPAFTSSSLVYQQSTGATGTGLTDSYYTSGKGYQNLLAVRTTFTKTFKFSKEDAYGKELKGATIELLDSANDVVRTWVSDGSTHEFSVLPGEYTLVEKAAPNGYKTATSIKVTVGTDGTIKKDGVTIDSDAPIVMVDDADSSDKSFTFSKQDVNGNELKGATIELQDVGGNTVETWVSDGTTHTFTVAPGEYTLVETATPEGYETATSIEVTVNTDGTIKQGKTTVSGNAPIVMVDEYKKQSFKFSKQDVAGNELKGATIELRKNDENGDVVEKWTSDGTTHTFNVDPGTYALVETATPDNYKIATTITVTVGTDGSIKKNGETVSGNAPIVMVDSYADHTFKFSKQDGLGNELAGATIQLQKSDGTVVEEWVSDGTTHDFTVEPGEYKLVETAKPQGYDLATSIAVTVGIDGTIKKDGVTIDSNAPIIMVDNLLTTVKFSKQDTEGNQLSGAKME